MSTRRASYDVVVVGAGHNGLVAAAYLARAGLSCLVLERLAEPGGAAVSEVVFPGVPARLSRYSYLVSLLPELIVAELGLDLRLARRRIASYTPDPRAGGARGLLIDAADPAASGASLRTVSKGAVDAGAWSTFYEMTARAARAIFPTLTEPLRSRAELRRMLGDEEAWETLFERPIGESVAAAFPDDLVAGVVLTDALIGTFASAGQRDLRQNRCFLYHVIGRGTGDWLVPIGGMGALTGELARVAREAGAELETGIEALAIGAGDDPEQAAEVRCGDGVDEWTVGARKVLVNAAPRELERLLGRTPAEHAEGAQVKVNMVLARLPRLRDAAVAPEDAFAGTFHANETAAQLEQAHRAALDGDLPDPLPCETYCHSLTDPGILDPSLRAQGVHTMTLFALQTPARLFLADPDGTRRRALAAALASLDSVLAEPIEDCLLHDGDGRPCVEVRTPLDIERELRMPGGHIFHRDLSWPYAESESEVGTWGVETDSPAVLLCGAGARRGGGVSGVPGRNAAMAVLEADRRPPGASR